ncbi:MAG: transposase family protein [Gemmatimonadota bacterium]|nr:transposase family protein [Gemmatimonadota bacterium]
MERKRLFEQALGLERSWYVEKTEFDDEERQLYLYLNFQAGGTFPCGSCGRDCKAYDTAWKQWRHLNFFEYYTLVHAPSPRVDCPSCGIRQARLPWTRRRSRFTLLFEALVVSMATEMSVRAVGRMVGEYDTRLWRIVNHYMGEESATDAEDDEDRRFEDGSARVPEATTDHPESVAHAKSP